MTYHLRCGLLKLAPIPAIPHMYFTRKACIVLLSPESRNTIQLPTMHIQAVEMVGGGTFGQHALGLVCACAVIGESVACQTSGIVACPPQSGRGIAHVQTVVCEGCVSAHTLPSVLVEQVVGEQPTPCALCFRHSIQIAVLDVRVVYGKTQLVCVGNYALLGIKLHHPHPNRHISTMSVNVDIIDGLVAHNCREIQSGHISDIASGRYKVDVAVTVCHDEMPCLLRPCYMVDFNACQSCGLIEGCHLACCIVVGKQTARSESEAHVTGWRYLCQVGVAGIHLPCAHSRGEGMKHG